MHPTYSKPISHYNMKYQNTLRGGDIQIINGSLMFKTFLEK